jgi:acid phosphatase class B
MSNIKNKQEELILEIVEVNKINQKNMEKNPSTVGFIILSTSFFKCECFWLF